MFPSHDQCCELDALPRVILNPRKNDDTSVKVCDESKGSESKAISQVISTFESNATDIIVS